MLAAAAAAAAAAATATASAGASEEGPQRVEGAARRGAVPFFVGAA